MRKKIRISESQMKRIIAESTRKVLKEIATLGKGTAYHGDNPSNSKEYTSDSDTLRMMVIRFGKQLGDDYKVEAYINSYSYEDNPEYPTDSPSVWLELNISFDSKYSRSDASLSATSKIFKTAKYIFGNERLFQFSQNAGCWVTLTLDVTDIVEKEPRRGQMPSKTYTYNDRENSIGDSDYYDEGSEGEKYVRKNSHKSDWHRNGNPRFSHEDHNNIEWYKKRHNM